MVSLKLSPKTNHSTMKITQFISAVVSLIFFQCAVPWSASARTFAVNATADVNDLDPGDGVCVAYLFINPPFVLPFCTLRAAIEEANALPGTDIIELPAAIMGLNIMGINENRSAEGDLDISESLTIIGKGADKTIIDGREIDRIVEITRQEATVTLKNLTLLNGRVADSTPGVLNTGAAIRNKGNLRLENVVLMDHQTVGGGNDDFGGILFNAGYCEIQNSTLLGGKAHEGGGIYNQKGAEMRILSSTITDNQAVSGAGVANYGLLIAENSTFSGNGNSQTIDGGGLENNSTTSLIHATFAFNRAEFGGGISNSNSLDLQNTIIANNVGGDCYDPQPINSKGNNLDSDGSCMLPEKSDITGKDPKLESLKNNGGATMTHVLAPLSPGRDAGIFITDLPFDQRGMRRPQGNGVDIGAVENSTFAMPPVIFPVIP